MSLFTLSYLVGLFWPTSRWKLFSNVKFLVCLLRLMSEALKVEGKVPVYRPGFAADFVGAH